MSNITPANIAAVADWLPRGRAYWLAERAHDIDELTSWMLPSRSREDGDELSALAFRRYQSARGQTVVQPSHRTIAGLALPWIDNPAKAGRREHVRRSTVTVAEDAPVYWRHQTSSDPLGHVTGWITDDLGVHVWLDLDAGAQQDAILTAAMFNEIGLSSGFRSRTAGVIAAGGPHEEHVRTDPDIVEVSLAAIEDVAYSRCTAYRELAPTVATVQQRQAAAPVQPPALYREVLPNGVQYT